MHVYEITKVVHFLGLISLVGFFIVYQRIVPGIRASQDMSQVRTWIGLLSNIRPMLPSGAIMMLASGLVMTSMRWRTQAYPFATIGLVVILMIAIGGSIAVARQLRALEAAATAPTGPVSDAVSRAAWHGGTWTFMLTVNFAAIGVLVLMTTKVGWIPAITIVMVLAAVGAFIGTRGRPPAQ